MLKNRTNEFIALMITGLTYFYMDKDFYESWSQWDRYSEVIVVGKIIQMERGNAVPGEFMGVYTDNWGDYNNYYILMNEADVSEMTYHSYTDAVGVHGQIWGGINLLLRKLSVGAFNRLRIIYFLNTFFTALTMGILLAAVYVKFGIGAVLGGCMILVPFKIFFSAIHNLYWCFGARLLPTVVSAIIVLDLISTNKWRKRNYLFIYLAILICTSHTFEFTTMEMLMCITPMMVWLVNNWNWSCFIVVFKSGIMCILGFLSSMVIWCIQLISYYKGSIDDALYHIWYIFGSRSGLDAISGENISETGKSVTAWQVVADTLYGEHAELQWGIKPFHLAVGVVLLFFVFFLHAHVLNKMKVNTSMLILVLFGLASSTSWLIISQGHSYWHPNLAIILWFYCLIPSLGIFSGWAIEHMIRNTIKRRN